MGPPLENYLRNGGEYDLGEDATEIIPDIDLHRICGRLHARTGNDFSSYKPSTIQRRIAKRMALHGINNVTDYIRYLNQDESEAGLLFREMLIRVTRFFRDPEQWEFCRSTLFPKLLSQHNEGVSFRVWVPGCATGEEAYTIAILLSEVIRESGINRDFQIFATDLDADAITIARRGEYPAGIISEVPETWLNRYFVYSDDHYKICKSIREQIVFAPHNVIKDPPFTHIDLISCRNLLIYLKQVTQLSLLSMFHMALRQDGTLILGPSESIGESSKLFEIIDGQWKVFKRNPDILSDRDPMRAFREMGLPNALAQGTPPVQASRNQKPDELAHHVWKLLALKYAPSALVTSERGDIFYFHGKAGSLLEPAEGKPRYNVLEMGRGNIPKELPALIRSAASSEGKMIEKVMTVDRETGRAASVSVEKLQSPGAMRGLFLIVFRDRTEQPPESVTRKAKEKRGENEPSGHVFQLERELEHSRESYQALLEQVETSNEELRSANEELQSTNEELQSSNEELETAKEETQSLYEELSSINSELIEKVNNLSDANDDMANLLNSTAMAILYLDNELKLKRFTDKAREIVAVRDSDEGRLINELAIYLENEHLIEDAEHVLSTLQGIEKEVKTVQGHWYLMKLLPYRTRENVVDGLICSFVEIDKIKNTENSELRFRTLLSQLPHPFLLVDARGVVFQISEAMVKVLGIEGAAVEGKPFADLIKGRFKVQDFLGPLGQVLDGTQDSALLALEPSGNAAVGNQSRTLEIRKLLTGMDEPVLAWVSAR
ncbi:CheR family methyltransferase [Marinobacter sp.]|uniref:CheR family methyltransferase n=1 Tax=Marinobacter sp. TaxID=50741 RepID=UPI003A8D86E1